MSPIIDPIPVEVLKSELTEDKHLRFTNKSGNEIYVITAQDSPNVMLEIGRLREIAFREAGGGTGKEVDIDEFDTMEGGYKQLIVWNPDTEEIIGGYRYLLGKEARFDSDGQPILATSHMFRFSERFLRDYLPKTIELGRSFVRVEYQSSRAGFKGLFALDNLWDGLGALVVIKPEARYFFGKMTMYPTYDRLSRDMILYFLRKHFDDPDRLILPKHPLTLDNDPGTFAHLFCEDDLRADYRILNSEVRKRGLNIPPLINAYMNLSPTMRMFGTAINDDFGAVEETGILIAFDEIFEEKKTRHIESFAKENPDAIRFTSGANKIFYKPKEQQPADDVPHQKPQLQ
ncbi:MAG: GNAT family N-acetyltransferase, partial [Bacteroidaceae bacterium]|nr:GNAT family N-acetyltransferase [Bacteroidaceae bacterium]